MVLVAVVLSGARWAHRTIADRLRTVLQSSDGAAGYDMVPPRCRERLATASGPASALPGSGSRGCEQREAGLAEQMEFVGERERTVFGAKPSSNFQSSIFHWTTPIQ